MADFIDELFAGGKHFMPHGHCYFWQPDVLWLNVIPDGVIALSYFTIPAALLVFHRRRADFAFPQVLVLFAMFIAACGATHALGVWTVWHPTYRLHGVVKLVTAVVSTLTAAMVWPLLPRALALPSPSELEASNVELRAAQSDLEALNADLERRVAARTLELQRTNAQLRRSNLELEHFAYVASHDLQAPLRTVAGFLELLEEEQGSALDDEGRDWIGRARSGTSRMQGMLDGLLQLSRVDVSSSPDTDVDLSHALQAAIQDMGDSLDQADIELSADALPTVQGDESQWIILFQNLLSNSVKYRAERPLQIHVEAQQSAELTRIVVSDTGQGIRAELLQEALQLFRRLAPNQAEGHGIGLAVCERIVRRHGGTLHLESDGTSGTRVIIELPS